MTEKPAPPHLDESTRDQPESSDPVQPERDQEPPESEPAESEASEPESPNPEPESPNPEPEAELAGPESEPEAPAGQPPRRTRGWLVGVVAGVLVGALAVAGVAVFYLLDHLEGDPGRAAVGDCLDQAHDLHQLRRVECDSPDAAWTVMLRVTGVAQVEFDDPARRQDLCDAASEWEMALWLREQRAEDGGDLLCLSPRT